MSCYLILLFGKINEPNQQNLNFASPILFNLIRPETVQSILETSRVEEVVGDFVVLKKRGSNYVGLCPFHNEKTPSFSVSPSKGIYKCFGCGKVGNSVGFIMEHEHYSFPEALKYLAKKYGIEVEEEQMTPEMQQELDERESMFAVNDFVTRYFSDNLFNDNEGKSIGLRYLKDRDFRESTIEKFQLGYAKDKWDDYSEYASKNGYKKEVLIQTGLSIDKDNRLFDRFRGRVIFPIHNLTGKVIGFGGRILSSEKSTAKYINSPESEIYNKSKVLYGIFFARQSMVKSDNCLLVEGYTDVISLHQAGIENVVASSGTSLTVDQIKLIRRFTPNVTILYDGDPAGIKASFRGIDLILEQGMNVKIVLFPEGQDPDSFVRSHRTSEVEEFIKKEAADFIKFKTNLLLDETVGDPTGRAALIKEIVNTIAHIPDGIGRSVYIKECSQVMEIAEQTLMNELNKVLRKRFSKDEQQPFQPHPSEEVKQAPAEQLKLDPLDISAHEKQLMRLLILFADDVIQMNDEETDETFDMKVKDFIIGDLDKENIVFENEVYNKIVNEYREASKKGIELDKVYFTNHVNKAVANTAIDLLLSPHQLSENWKAKQIYVKTEEDQLLTMVFSSLLTLKSRLVSKQLKKLSDAIKVANDDAEIFVLQQQFFELKNIATQLDNELTRAFHF